MFFLAYEDAFAQVVVEASIKYNTTSILRISAISLQQIRRLTKKIGVLSGCSLLSNDLGSRDLEGVDEIHFPLKEKYRRSYYSWG